MTRIPEGISSMILRWLVCIAGLFCWIATTLTTAEALDQRKAFVIGHQHGWKSDPTLKFALKGDLRPMAKALGQIGFQVQMLQNPSATKVRQRFAAIKRALQQEKGATTFLFYYTGHADQTHFHLGKRGKQPLRLQEFVDFFKSLKVTRKFAIIDSCYSGQIIRKFGSLARFKKLLQSGSHKGVRAKSAVDLRKLMLPNQGSEEGIRIISSSLDLAWELKRYKASVFTHHLLHGIRGKADLNRDGKITVDELFDFASKRVIQDTGQRPQQWVHLKRGQPYALAPAYKSRLWIGPTVVGHLKVTVANFVWSQTKHLRRPWQLSVVNGAGRVFLKRNKRCFQQDVYLPKGRMTRLPTSWKPVGCLAFAQQTAKGSITIPIQQYSAPYKPFSPNLRWGLMLGYANTSPGTFAASQLSVGALLRAKHWGLALTYQLTPTDTREFQFHRLALQGELGTTFSLVRPSMLWQWFIGGYAQAGTMLQIAPSQQAISPLLGAGLVTDVTLWAGRHVGVRLGGIIGPSWTPSVGKHGFSLHWELRGAIVFPL